MTKLIKHILETNNLLTCPDCRGTGNITVFCGSDCEETCVKCNGGGAIKSLTIQKHRKPCFICNGREGGCAGGCNYKGYQEWETYELYDPKE